MASTMKKSAAPTFADRMREGLRRMIGGSYAERSKAKNDAVIEAQSRGMKPTKQVMGLRRRID